MNKEKIIDLTSLAPDQKVKMKKIFSGQIGTIEKQITPLTYDISLGLMHVVASKEFFDLIK